MVGTFSRPFGGCKAKPAEPFVNWLTFGGFYYGTFTGTGLVASGLIIAAREQARDRR
jgi:hypothetical protein